MEINTTMVENTLQDYLEKIVPALLKQDYHLRLAKGGQDYSHLPEQSLFTHILNGVFGLSRLVQFSIDKHISVPQLDKTLFRKALAAYTIHEVHKDNSVQLLGSSEFSIPLEQLREEYECLGLNTFATLDEHLMRAANVHKRSSKHGDLLISEDPNAQKLWLLVRIADSLASAKTPSEAVDSLGEYLKYLAPSFAFEWALYYHKIPDVRGVLTNAIHQAVARKLEADLRFFPLLYFATGTLYIGPREVDTGLDDFIDAITDQVLQLLTQGAGRDEICDGLRSNKYDFERYVYAFASIEDLLQVVYDKILTLKAKSDFALEEIGKLADKRRHLPEEWRETVEQRLGIRLLDPREYKTFNELWFRVYHYLLYVDTLVRDLLTGQDRLNWFLGTFAIPQPYANNLHQEQGIWASGGIGKYVLVIAYHFLRGPTFAHQPAETYPCEVVLQMLHQKVVGAFRQVGTVTQEARQQVVEELRPDLEAYLRENLHLSFAPVSQLQDDGLASYVKAKTKSHTGKICSLCNRYSEYVCELRTGILDDYGRVFSNRVLPTREALGNRLWCPICQLEAILRKRAGMGLPSRAHYENSYCIYIYVFPTYSFTSEHIRLFRPLFEPFVHVTSLPLRDYDKDNLGLPHYWLEHRTFNPQWMNDLKEVLRREKEKITSLGGRNFVGERLLLGCVENKTHYELQPHYYLIMWQKAARSGEKDDARVATRTEAWAKALFASAAISGLTGCKVYVTERPHLPVTDPAELKATITLDSPPPALRGLLGGRSDVVTLYGREKGLRSGLEQVLNLSAALWTVTTEVHAPNRNTKDKHIASRLKTLNTSPLAGATFYKEYGRLNDGQSPPSTLTKACEILLEIQGGELMNLVDKIAEKSLKIALPFGTPGRGKAHRYELVFREAVSAMRNAQRIIPEMCNAALGKQTPSPESIAELKRLTAGALLKGLRRRQENHRGEIMVPAWGQEELSQLVGEFVDILVDDLYLGRAGGNFARFLQLENQLANGIYYYTDRNLSRAWEEYKEHIQRKAARAAAAQFS